MANTETDSQVPKILVVAAHADDEALGCAGTILGHTRAGHDVAVLYMTDGVGARNPSHQAEIEQRSQAMKQALESMNVQYHQQFDFPDNALDSIPLLQLIRALESYCSDWGIPDRVYTHHPGDLNVDHRLTHAAVMTCFRPQPDCLGKPSTILSFEVPSSTHWQGSQLSRTFHPNYFVDISTVLEEKRKVLTQYQDEMRPWPHARSIEAVEHLARFRGSLIGVEAAEGFVVERIVEKPPV